MNPRLYTSADWDKRLQSESALVTRVSEQPKIWLIGSEEEDADLISATGVNP